jgi:SecD/SecF fusion protein
MVLFWIGTDQIKGFATTLIIGIAMSVYSAVFLSRIVFDIAERQNWIRGLKMMQIVRTTNIDFMRLAIPTIAASCVLIAIGMIALVLRGRDMLNIDFTGGVSASMVLREDAAMSQGDVSDALEATELGGRNLLVVEQREIGADESESGRRFTIYARIDDAEITQTGAAGEPLTSVQYVQQILQQTFGEKLQTYAVTIESIEALGASQNVFSGGSEAAVVFEEPVAYSTVEQRLAEIVPATVDGKDVVFTVSRTGYAEGSSERFRDWTVRINLSPDVARPLLEAFESELDTSPLFPLANRIGGQVAGNMQRLAALAIFFSLLCIIGYIWLRFQQVMFGLAAVIALVHDVLVTIGMLAISAWIVDYAPPVAFALQIEPFQISLQVVAVLLTIIGYSINDTIVIFDRIREVRGKSPQLTAEMINASVNQTLSRTILTGLTTFMSVTVLYIFGGPGIHAFAFALVVGVMAGIYSTVFIASPALLWMSRPSKSA